MLQGFVDSDVKLDAVSACKPDVPRATKPTEATILFIKRLLCLFHTRRNNADTEHKPACLLPKMRTGVKKNFQPILPFAAKSSLLRPLVQTNTLLTPDPAAHGTIWIIDPMAMGVFKTIF